MTIWMFGGNSLQTARERPRGADWSTGRSRLGRAVMVESVGVTLLILQSDVLELSRICNTPCNSPSGESK